MGWLYGRIPRSHMLTRGETQWFLTRSHFTVVECQPRLLIVSIRAPFLSWVVVVAHAPSEPPAPQGSAAAFWLSCKKVLSRCSRDAEVILLADANARVGGLVSDSVGPHGAEEESKTAPDFHQFLAETSLQLPSTFAGCHSGICHTWTSPTGLRHRIDYIAVPAAWPLSCIQTHVWDTFEALQLRDDHFPLVLRATLACRSQGESSVCFSHAAVHPSKDADPSLYIAGMTQVLSSRPVAWHTGVDPHYAHLATEWTRWGRTLCQPEERKPRQSYLTTATLQLVAWRKAWRSQLHVWKQWHRSRTLAICFLLWRSEIQPVTLGQSGISGLCAWADQFLLCIAQAALLIYRVGRHIKSSAKGDRAAYLAKLAHEVALSDLKDPKLLYQRVRREPFLPLEPARDLSFARCRLFTMPTGNLPIVRQSDKSAGDSISPPRKQEILSRTQPIQPSFAALPLGGGPFSISGAFQHLPMSNRPFSGFSPAKPPAVTGSPLNFCASTLPPLRDYWLLST